MSRRVAISGAGPAGLCLANLLSKQAGFSVRVFERDAHLHATPQGGSLDLHEDAQAAIQSAGLFSEFKKYARYGDQDSVIMDKHGKVHMEMKEPDQNKPEIDRGALREILANGLPKDIIKWGTKVDRVEPRRVHFGDGSSEQFDLIVGADGAWSKVRPLLTTVPPFYAGISGYDANIRNASTKHPELVKALCNGTTFVTAGSEGCFVVQKNGNDCYKSYYLKPTPEDWVKTNGIERSGETQRKAILEDMRDWSPFIRDIVKAYDDDIVQRPIYMLMPGIAWDSKPTVTAIGDAISLQSPYAGLGVNTAIAEAHKLAQCLIQHKDDQHKAIEEYEAWTHEYARSKMELSWNNLQMFMKEGAIEKIKMFIEMQAAEAGAEESKPE
ncbi:hypothetical protein E3P99_02272 [Wallemia hederae]|uniref:FAD-binding domain-containing protein n=1 Tax=Wallemia hederae TaxID=1540922 RepID=A0A4V4LT70_9BASI|nr:hypothetical protein E3P99_02272 [Wallemia hederae]